MIVHYIKIAFRNLLQYKVQNFISVLGVAIGFTAFVLGGYWYYWEHRFDTFHPDWKCTYAVTTQGMFKTADGSDGELTQLHQSVASKLSALPEIESVCYVSDLLHTPEGKDKSWIGMKVDSTFFRLFQCQLLEGGYRGNAYNGQLVLLTERTARYLFGDSSCVGKEFRINKSVAFTVGGVMKTYPGNSQLKFDYLLLATPEPNGRQRYTTYIQVTPTADIDKLTAKISALQIDAEDTKWEKYSCWKAQLRSLPEVHLCCSPGLEARFRNINILAVAGLLAFVSALMNLLVLFIGQQQRKVRYNATFFTLGASFREMIGKNLLELILPLLLAFLLSMALIEILLPFYQEYTHLENDGIYDGFTQYIFPEEIFYIAAVLYPISAVLFLILSAFPVMAILKRKQHTTSRLLRRGLIAGQIFIGSLFLMVSLAFYQQFRFMNQTDKGMVVDHIWQVDLGFDAVWAKDCTPFVESLRNSPSIKEVTSLTQSILSPRGEFYCSYIYSLPIEGRNETDREGDNCVVVEKNFLSFFGMKMKEGEWIRNEGTLDYVVNETGARKLGIPSLSGRHIEATDNGSIRTPSRVSGVLADYYFCPMQYPITKTFFLCQQLDQMYLKFRYFYFKAHPQNEEKALAYVRQLYKEYDKGEISPPKQVVYLPHLMEEFNRPEKTMFRIFLLLAAICILISSFGIYSLVALSTEQRKKEIAIRKVNGATFKSILYLFLREYLILVIAGNALALPLGAVFIQHWLETYAYHTQLHGWLFIGVFLITGVIVVLSVTRQVILAARINAAVSIKST